MLFTARNQGAHLLRRLLLGLLLGASCSSALWAQVTVTVVGSDGASLGSGYRYLVEHDTTYTITPGVVSANPLSLNFHKSHFPVLAKGESATGAPTVLASSPLKRYVSILPKAPGQYSIGGASIPAGSAAPITIVLNKLPLPTAQISVFVFEDTSPIDNAPGINEKGLANFNIQLEDAGGRYGASAGTQFWDAFGNPLGTQYESCTPPGPTCINGYRWIDGGPVVTSMGTGVLKTDASGRALIKHLAPGKYGIQAIPPIGQGWQQTTTIEGTKVIDAWVSANEPPYFKEFGPASFHAFFGFVKQMDLLATVPRPPNATLATIMGRVVQLRMGRPPDLAFYNGGPFEYTTPWIGLNDTAQGKGLYVKRGNADGTFSIPNVPPGTYQLVVFDDNMDIIINFSTVVVALDGTCNLLGSCNLGDIPVNPWFTRQLHYVFHDDGCAGQPGVTPAQTAAWKENGYREPCEKGLGAEWNVNLRWRDGTINQFAATDLDGHVPFDEIFPFFSWQIAEVDYKAMKPTGVTVTVDNGGPVNANLYRSFEGQTGPQPQYCTASDVANENNPACFGKTVGIAAINPYSGVEPGGPNNLSRTEKGPNGLDFLLQGYQGFIGQTTVFEWGKVAYLPGQNGGIAGVVYYGTTRAEDDPEQKVQAPWEPGIPGITVRLWTTKPDPLNPLSVIKDQMVVTTVTDSWDAAPPEGCQGEPFVYNPGGGLPSKTADCYDGFRNHSQVRGAVFDGGYAFSECLVNGTGKCVPAGTPGATLQSLPIGEYIVEVVPPTGMEVVKSQDKNVDFGDDWVPAPNLTLPECVGTPYVVPQYLTLFPGVEANKWGETLKLCDQKLVALNPGQNAAADFFLFTEVPASARIIGTITDDLNNTANASSLMFGEKFSPRWVGVAIRDWTGREISRTYSDEFGRYNLLVPSTYSANLPQPSGISPSMLFTCINPRVVPYQAALGYAPGTCTLPAGCPDPFFRPSYTESCYVFQFMPAVTTYLDTPMFPIAAQAGRNELPVDCELRDGTPRISSVTAPANGAGGGPYVPAGGGTVTINSVGTLDVKNPDFCPGPPWSSACPINLATTVQRDYGFGATQGTGKVMWGTTQLTVNSWSNAAITVTVPGGAATSDQLVVTRGNGLSTVAGVTLTRGGPTPKTVPAQYPTIQAAIDAAANGDLILVSPGVYREMVIMNKPVQLQGWGEGSTSIDALPYPGFILAAWRTKVDGLLGPDPCGAGSPYLRPGQGCPVNAPQGVKPLAEAEGAGVLVLSNSTSLFTPARRSRIDGFSITGAEGAGVVVNGNIGQTGAAVATPHLAVSNNRIFSNYGIWGGGVRVGSPLLISGTSYVDSLNDNVWVHHNQITFNGGTDGSGGGVAMCTGADFYQVTDNFVCGNFIPADGGGIGHIGLNKNALIARNTVLFNESFNGQITVSGGGISIAGLPPLPPATISPGAGSVKVNGNLVQGNHAGAGDGGGIAVSRFNGQDASSGNQNNWYLLEIYNNIVDNNIAAVAGGGISLADVVRSNVTHNTIVRNDSTATALLAFPPGFGACAPGATTCPQQTIPQPAGLASRPHSAQLLALRNWPQKFSNPDLYNNIIYQNRSFYFFGDAYADPPIYLMLPDLASGQPANYWDLGVVGATQNNPNPKLQPQNCLLTSTQYYAGSNVTGNPAFLAQYFNGDGNTGTAPALHPAVAFDEGGNAIKIRYGPLTQTLYVAGLNNDTLRGNYHIGAGSVALNAGSNLVVVGDLLFDYDLEPRPAPIGPQGQRRADIGADERQQ